MNYLCDLLNQRPPPLILTGVRILLRTPRPEDWFSWSEQRGRSRNFLEPWEPEWPVDALSRRSFRRRLAAYADDWQRGASFSFFVFLPNELPASPDPLLIGGIALTEVRRGAAQSASLGYWIAADHAGRGYMTEATSLALRFAFETLVLQRIEAVCLPENDASQRLLLKSGFQPEGTARGILRIGGARRDHLRFGILQDDWKIKRTL